MVRPLPMELVVAACLANGVGKHVTLRERWLGALHSRHST